MITEPVVNMNEWESILLEGVELFDQNARQAAKLLTEKRIIEVIELKRGLSITTNSYVGRIKLGFLQININPKINGMPLYELLKYAYGLRDLKLFNTANHSFDNFSFFDLLIYELYIEAENLMRRGIQKSYIQKEENRSSPRGKIDMSRLCNQGGLTKGTLPCKYFNRDEDHILNRVMLAGIKLGLKLVIDDELKINLRRLCYTLEETIQDIPLSRNSLRLAHNNISRLTGRYSSLLEIINILYESQGIQLEDETSRIDLRGYFFDMNAFFENLVGRLFVNCSDGYSLKEQFSLHNLFMYTPGFNPNRRKSPTPRPDFALMVDGKVLKVMDAKYRDLWARTLPSEMLYQLSIYALSGIGNGTATILYPSINDIPIVQKIDINDPISGSKLASVIVQPINLMKIAQFVSNDPHNLKAYVDQISIQ